MGFGTMHVLNIFYIKFILGCTVAGLRGDGSSRGTCAEKHLCNDKGVCDEACTVLGPPGTWVHRGSCPEGKKCSSTGQCLEGKLYY